MALNNYVEDDWNDNAITSRTSPETDIFHHPSGNTQAGDVLTGMYRPEWTVSISGPQATNQRLQHDVSNGNGQVFTKSKFYIGSMQCDFQWHTTPGSDNDTLSVYPVMEGDTGSGTPTGVRLIVQDAGDYRLFNQNAGSDIISSSWSPDQNAHTAEVTRDPYGNWELLLDGSSQGTGSDTYLPDPLEGIGSHWNDGGGGSIISVDNLVVT